MGSSIGLGFPTQVVCQRRLAGSASGRARMLIGNAMEGARLERTPHITSEGPGEPEGRAAGDWSGPNADPPPAPPGRDDEEHDS
jgi:hypothetical protein